MPMQARDKLIVQNFELYLLFGATALPRSAPLTPLRPSAPLRAREYAPFPHAVGPRPGICPLPSRGWSAPGNMPPSLT
eukprot:1188564-Prorocentrum_minimum.AAC.1